MPKYPTFPTCLDEVQTITVGWLRQMGLLKPNHLTHGCLQWTKGGNVSVITDTNNQFIELSYTTNGKPIRYRVDLETRPSNLGIGRVWYFICPATGKRCRNLYYFNGRFLSRHAVPSAMYRSQVEPKRYRRLRRYITLAGTTKQPKAVWDLSNRKLYRAYYNGKPTKRYQDYLERKRKIETLVSRGIF